MVSVFGIPIPIPLSVGGVVGFLIDALLIFIVLLIADMIISHGIEPKRSLIMSLVAYFITPIVSYFIATAVSLPLEIMLYLIPLVVWIALAEVLLEHDTMEKLKIAVLAFVVYIILIFAGVTSMIAGLIPI
jgi:hypothetical protein